MIELPPQERLDRYLELSRGRLKIKRFLGGGTDGSVWESFQKTAIKVLSHERGYYNERDTYLRLQEWGLTPQIDGFWVPELVGYHDELMIVEMEMMQDPPYIIDFAKVRLNSSPDFSDEVLEAADQKGLEEFEHNWPAVKSLLRTLEDYLIYYLDPRPGNITFKDLR